MAKRSIKIKLSTSSISKAITELQALKVQLSSTNMLLESACYRIIELANLRVDSIDGLSQEIKDGIKIGWARPAISGNFAIITNTNDKAVYIEFGVGIVGEQVSHPNASMTGYEYDVDSPYKKNTKFGDRTWFFGVGPDEAIDIRQKNILATIYARQGKTIATRGNEPGLYLFNAMLDFMLELQLKF